MKKIIVLLLTGLLIIISGCSTFFGPTEEELQQAKQQQEIKKAKQLQKKNKEYKEIQEMKAVQNKAACEMYMDLYKKFPKKQIDNFFKQNHINNHLDTIIFPKLYDDDKMDYSGLNFKKGEILLILFNTLKVFQNIPNVGVLISLEGAYNTKFNFMIKGYHDIDGANINKELLLINDGIFSYESTLGIRTVYSFKMAKGNKNIISNVIDRLYYSSPDINETSCKKYLKHRG